MTDPAMRPAFEQWLKQVAPHGHERDHWHVWQAAWGARVSLSDPSRAALVDELNAAFEAYLYAPAIDKALARVALEKTLWNNKSGIIAYLRAPLPGSLDLQGAASFIDELIEEDCDDSIRAVVRKTILGAALPLTLNSGAVTDDAVETACAAYAKATDYYVEFHRGLSSESSDRMRRGMRAALTALPRAVQGGAGKTQFLTGWMTDQHDAALSPNTGDEPNLVIKDCFWPRCSDSQRCREYGSCVALAQRKAIAAGDFPSKPTHPNTGDGDCPVCKQSFPCKCVSFATPLDREAVGREAPDDDWEERGAAAELRNETIQECAKIARDESDSWIKGDATTAIGQSFQRACRQIELKILALTPSLPRSDGGAL